MAPVCQAAELSAIACGRISFGTRLGASAPSAGPAKALALLQPPAGASTVLAGTLRIDAAYAYNTGAGKLITNDGGGLITNDGASLIGNDGAGLIGNDGAGAVAPAPGGSP